jgi:acetyl esterase
MHPEMQFLLDARDRAGGPGSDVVAYRRFWNAYAAVTASPRPADMQVWDGRLATGWGGVAYRVYRPAGPPGPRPGIVYLHGGGFMLGDLDSSDTTAWGLAQESGAAVVSVDYRLAPEHPAPAAFEDSWAVLAWLGRDGGQLGLDPARLAVAGDSAGGNLAAALSLAARDRGGPALRAQAAIYPWVGISFDHPSYRENALGPGLTLESMLKFRQAYLGGADSDDPYAMPIKARSFAGLPPALVVTAALDPLRDDGRVYAARLAEAGSDVTYRECPGLLHGFLRARLAGPHCAAEFARICGFLRAALAELRRPAFPSSARR